MRLTCTDTVAKVRLQGLHAVTRELQRLRKWDKGCHHSRDSASSPTVRANAREPTERVSCLVRLSQPLDLYCDAMVAVVGCVRRNLRREEAPRGRHHERIKFVVRPSIMRRVVMGDCNI
jgi:hypothetical protein